MGPKSPCQRPGGSCRISRSLRPSRSPLGLSGTFQDASAGATARGTCDGNAVKGNRQGMCSRRARVLTLALVLAVLECSSSAGAEEWAPLASGDPAAVAQSESAASLVHSDGESAHGTATPRRFAIPPLRLAAAETPLALRAPAVSRRGLATDHSDSEPPPTWRMDSPPPQPRLAARDESQASGAASAMRRPRSSTGRRSSRSSPRRSGAWGTSCLCRSA